MAQELGTEQNRQATSSVQLGGNVNPIQRNKRGVRFVGQEQDNLTRAREIDGDVFDAECSGRVS
jgi:hypothetical protein